MVNQTKTNRAEDRKDAKLHVWPFLALLFTGLLLVNAIWLFPTLRDVQDNTSRLRLEVAERTAERVDSFMENKMRALNHTALAMRFAKERSQELVERLLKENPEFNSLSIIDQKLNEVFKISRFQVVKKGDLTNFSASDNFKKVLAGEVYQGPVLRDQTLEPFMVLAVPLILGEKEKAILFGELNLKFLSNEVSRFKFGKTGKVYLIDNTAKIIIHPDISLVLKGLNIKYPVETLGGSQGVILPSFRHLNEKGTEVEASSLFLPNLNWMTISEQDVSEINILRNRIIFVAAFSFSTGALLLLLLFQNRLKLVGLNRKLNQYLDENYLSAKLLVQRDRELMTANYDLENLNIELSETAKVLVRRDIELMEANERLEELDKTKSDFVSVAAHQLRTPLTGIKWTLYTLIEGVVGKLNSKQKQFAQDTFRTTERIIRIVNNLLNLARLEEGKTGYIFQRQSIVPILNTSVRRYEKVAREKGIALTMIQSAQNIPLANVDEEKLLMVFDNLFDNAIKYTSPGGTVTIKLTVENTDLRVEVSDTGIGIPSSQFDQVFKKFFRANNAQLYQTDGTGLGLNLAKVIIERHNGTISFKSVEEKGTTFIVTVPYIS